ncbi:MAG: STAS domain-containing protein, partial [Alphaproteobacteria bacterium]|nr:STAS domain-containing protein [Alphaproteobacteria bacterium]
MTGSTRIATAEEGGKLIVAPAGRWAMAQVPDLDDAIQRISVRGRTAVTIDLSGIDYLDTAGALALFRGVRAWRAFGTRVEVRGGSADQRALLESVARHQPPLAPERQRSSFVDMVAHLGAGTIDVARETIDLIGFLGRIVVALLATLRQPQRLRLTSLFFHMEEVGLNAVPIVGLMAFLLGVVLAFQGASQLQRFGAEIFVVNLVAISLLREIGVLMTAIVVAGRSGSAFTAQIGSMQVNQETDALQAMGLEPVDVLVVPRLLALVITLPLLAFFADLVGL